ncbi:Hsp20/alpha crystallin family protein [Bacillus sp. ISL-18]|uniref:Hsp20/alpha crystallin family protein n=1 Tax=Bacillus sp. ISL-18 TaxID=2819118 RepID=UPI001BE601D2|nr:Hsp20/alpha crystallin family protein [Bacillus sp. ISL-18]MBT2659068.1 Hsp20/alpha crystallin family protein [Bacillus sp. ISL-18]
MVKPLFHSQVKQMLGADFSELLQELSPFVEPRIDIYEANRNYVLSVDLAGANKQDLSVKWQNHTIMIEGTINHPHPGESIQVIRRERFYGTFIREISIPEKCDLEQLQAVFEKGILLITIPFKNSKENNHDID